MPYDMTLELPEFKNEKDGVCTYTHNHPITYTYKWKTYAGRKEMRACIEKDKEEINRCMFFAQNCLQNKNLTGVQQATLKQVIKNDEALIKDLSDIKPSLCVIL